jgi:hypothetical protein
VRKYMTPPSTDSDI